MSILHILNGDSTAQGFADTGLEGDVMIWREALSEGPLEENISSGSFWKARQNWICASGETPEGYQHKVLDQLPRFNEDYDEINLWFEFDLHCQVNLLGVLNFLKQQYDLSAPAAYLICPSGFPDKPDFAGMGELNGEELEYLFDNIRLQLSGIDFIIAAEAWKVYVKKDAESLARYIGGNSFWGSLHLLKPALQAQRRRLELDEAGLSYIERVLLDIYNTGITTKDGIYKAFWKKEKIYGMGDMEIDIYLKKLADKGLIAL